MVWNVQKLVAELSLSQRTSSSFWGGSRFCPSRWMETKPSWGSGSEITGLLFCKVLLSAPLLSHQTLYFQMCCFWALENLDSKVELSFRTKEQLFFFIRFSLMWGNNRAACVTFLYICSDQHNVVVSDVWFYFNCFLCWTNRKFVPRIWNVPVSV